MPDEEPRSPKPIPFSGYLDIALSVLLPLVGVSVVLLTVFELFVRPLVPVGAILPSLIGIVTCGLLVGIVNAVRYVRKAYKR